jgi:hypothetical protein
MVDDIVEHGEQASRRSLSDVIGEIDPQKVVDESGIKTNRDGWRKVAERVIGERQEDAKRCEEDIREGRENLADVIESDGGITFAEYQVENANFPDDEIVERAAKTLGYREEPAEPIDGVSQTGWVHERGGNKISYYLLRGAELIEGGDGEKWQAARYEAERRSGGKVKRYAGLAYVPLPKEKE